MAKREEKAQGEPETPKKRGKGRPTIYNQKVADHICGQIALGKSLREICRADDMPQNPTVIAWAQDPKHPFYEQYERARKIAYLAMADEIAEIADGNDSDLSDLLVGEGEDLKIDAATMSAMTARDRLRVDTRKWILSKMLPKVYGDKKDDDTKSLGVTVNIVRLSDGGEMQTIDAPTVDIKRLSS